VISCNPSHVGWKNNDEFWSTNKEVIGAHVDPPTINTARAGYTTAIAFGPRDVAMSGISSSTP